LTKLNLGFLSAPSDDFYFSNALIIHHVRTKEITTVQEETVGPSMAISKEIEDATILPAEKPKLSRLKRGFKTSRDKMEY